MQQVMSVLLTQTCEFGSKQRELDGIEIVALATTIATHNHVVLGTELLDLLLASKGSKARS